MQSPPVIETESLTNSDLKTKEFKKEMDKRRTLFSTDVKDLDQKPILGLIPISWINIAQQHGLVISIVLGCWLCSLLGVGIAGMLIVGAFCSKFMMISLDRTKRSIKAEVEKAYNLELINFQNEDGAWTNGERVEWLNAFVEKYWGMFEPILSEIIVGVVDPYLELYKPAFLDDLKFKEFSLGSNGIRINTIAMNRDVEDDIIYMIMNVLYAPVEDNADANSNIIMEIRLGKGIASTSIPVSVKNTYFEGKLHCRIKLMTKFPHVKVVEVWFEELPVIDFVLKPLGNLSMDVMNLPGIKNAIVMIINMVLNSILVAPVRMPIDVDAILNGVVNTGPVGILKLHLQQGKNFKNTEILGKSDPYCDILLNGRLVASTDVFENTLNPHFDELKFLLIYDVQLDKITFDVKDHDQVGFKTVGKSDFFLLEHLEEAQIIDKELTLLNKESKEDRGTLVFDSFWYPVEDSTTASPTTLSKSLSGILRCTVHQCKQLQGEVKSITGSYNPYFEVVYNGDVVYKSKTKKRTNNPRFEETADVFIPNKSTGKLLFNFKDQRDLASDPIIGNKEFTITYILSKKNKQDWMELSDCASGKMLITFDFKPVHLSESDLSTVIPAKSVLKLSIHSCKQLKNKEVTGTSDPYCQLECNNRFQGKTKIVHNSLNPEFNHTLFIPIRTFREQLTLECYDYNQMTKDKKMGQCGIKFDKTQSESPIDLYLSDKKTGQAIISTQLYNLIESSSVIPIINSTSSGFLQIMVHEITDVETDSYHFVVVVDGVEVYTSKTKKKTNNPIFEESFDVFLKELMYSVAYIKIYKNDAVYGEYGLNCNTLKDWMGQLIRLPVNSSFINVVLKVAPTNYQCTADQSAKSYGKLIINIKEASNLGQGDFLGGCDPYCSVFLGEKTLIKTQVHKKTENPKFGESVEVMMDNICTDKLQIELRDHARIGPHKLFGGIIIPNLSTLIDQKQLEDVYDLGKQMTLKIKYTFEPMPLEKYSINNEPPILFVSHRASVISLNQKPTITNQIKDNIKETITVPPSQPQETTPISQLKTDTLDESNSDEESGISTVESTLLNSSTFGTLSITVIKARNLPAGNDSDMMYCKMRSSYGKGGLPKKHLSSICKSKPIPYSIHPMFGTNVVLCLPDPTYARNGHKYRFIVNGSVCVQQPRMEKLIKGKVAVGDFQMDIWQYLLNKVSGDNSRTIDLMEDIWMPLVNKEIGGEVLVSLEGKISQDYIGLLQLEKQNGHLDADVTIQKRGTMLFKPGTTIKVDS